MSINDLRERLFKGTPKEKSRAVQELVGLKSRDAGKILVQALKQEKQGPVREQIQKGIAYLKKVLSKPASEDSSPKPRVDITDQVLERVRSALMSDNEEERKKALGFIVKNNVKELIPFLLETAHNRNHIDLMVSSLKVIEKLQAVEHREDLFEFLRHGESRVVISAINTSLSLNVLDTVFPILKELCQDERDDVAKASSSAIEQLAKQGDEEAADFLKEKEESEKEPDIFIPEGMDDLLPQLRQDAEMEKKEDEKKKRREAVILYRYKEELESEDPEKRKTAIRKLAEAKDPEAIELITQILANESDPYVLATGVSSLGHLGRESAVPTLQNYLNHDDQRVRANAVDAICELLGKEAPKPMLERLLKDPSHRVRANVILAVFDTKPNECFLALSTLAQSTDLGEQMSALYCFEALQQDTHLGMLQRFYTGGEERTREKTMQILENWSGDREITAFILNEPAEKFQEFYKAHLEQKRLEAKSKENQVAAKPPAEPEESESGELDLEMFMDKEEEVEPKEEESFFSRLMKRFR